MILALRERIYKKCYSDKELLDLVTGIYFQVPPNTKFPYIYIGDFHSKNISTKDQHIEEVNFKIVIYLRDKSDKLLLIISNKIKNILSCDSYNLLYFKELEINSQNDGLTKQVIISFRALEFTNDL